MGVSVSPTTSEVDRIVHSGMLRETATLECLAGVAVLLVCLLVGGCPDLYVVDRVSQSPPVSPEVDCIV